MSKPPIDEEVKSVSYSNELEFLSRAAAEFFDISPEQNIYEIIGTRLKEIAGNAFIIINGYDKNTRLFQIKSLKGLGDSAESVIKLLNKHPEEMAVMLNDAEAMRILLTGKMVKGPEGL